MFCMSLILGSFSLWKWLLLLGLLIPATISDIKEKRIGMIGSIIGCFAGVILNMCFENDVWTVLAGLIPGTILLVISFLSHRSVGEGDGLILMAIGCILGIRKGFAVIVLALLISMPVSAFLLLFKKAGRKTAIPFVPFLFLGSIISGLG